MSDDESLSERLPTRDEADKASQAGTVLARHRNRRGGLSLHVRKGARAADVDLPSPTPKIADDGCRKLLLNAAVHLSLYEV